MFAEWALARSAAHPAFSLAENIIKGKVKLMQTDKKAKKPQTVDLFANLTETEKTQAKMRGGVAAALINAQYRHGYSVKKMAAVLGTKERRLRSIMDVEASITLDELIDWFDKLDIQAVIRIVG